MAHLAPPYQPRKPTETVLYGVVRETIETFLAHARETYSSPLPRYVERELRGYLRCGVFALGFTRCHCDTCGRDLLVAFACKGRGLCPSCAGRRMANTAAHLVDRVLPDVPVRQFVLSLPYELRMLAAFKPDVLSAIARIFVEAVFASYRGRAGLEEAKRAQCGAITFVQRFGGSLNLNVHFHTVFLDGVFTRDAQERVLFHPAREPDASELESIAGGVHRRVTAWLARHGYVDGRPAEDRSTEPAEPGALEACAAIAMQRGAFARLSTDEDHGPDHAQERAAGKMRFAAEHEGFNLHAGVRIAAGDDLGRERLARYGARPALALDRLRRLPGGRVAYRVKYARHGAAKHRVMTSLELMARLVALVPPPRYPLVRFHGVLGPRSSWRRDVVPRPSAAAPACERAATATPGRGEHAAPGPEARAEPRPPGTPAGEKAPGTPVTATAPAAPTAPRPPQRPAAGEVIRFTPSVISVLHWQRLHDGALLAASPYVDWASLLRRTFEVDVLACAHCGGRLRVLSVITEPGPVRRILDHLGLDADAPPIARARDPTDELDEADASAPV